VRELGLRVDVCNRRALEQGVPAMRSLLGAAGIRATFFVAFGPDRSGRSLRRILEPGFVSKLFRTRAHRMYGWRTLLYGTLLPAPRVGEALPEQLRAIESDGHELGVHGWDHAGWLNRVGRMSEVEVRECYRLALDAFERVLGHRALATAAPGWRCSAHSLHVADELGFAWASDCRGSHPFRPRVEGKVLDLLQIPTTLPTSDELLGSLEASELPSFYLQRMQSPGPHVMAVHAEAEGLLHPRWLEVFLERVAREGFVVRTLGELARLHADRAPVRGLVWRAIPGRAGDVACAEDG
jgi:peptidoglycan/xylan/chitin deacetylase (PgdA/CDA1 family)